MVSWLQRRDRVLAPHSTVQVSQVAHVDQLPATEKSGYKYKSATNTNQFQIQDPLKGGIQVDRPGLPVPCRIYTSSVDSSPTGKLATPRMHSPDSLGRFVIKLPKRFGQLRPIHIKRCGKYISKIFVAFCSNVFGTWCSWQHYKSRSCPFPGCDRSGHRRQCLGSLLQIVDLPSKSWRRPDTGKW